MKNKLVSIVIPTNNREELLENSVKSIRSQSYRPIEIIIVNSYLSNKIKKIGTKYKCRICQYIPNVAKGVFDAPYKRNYGAKIAKGDYIYYVDEDMELGRNVVDEAVRMCISSYAAVIISEDSFGEGIWAKAKNLERSCYWGDDTVEAPRFFNKKIWKDLGGLDENLVGGGDDWDLYQKLLENGYKTGRIKSIVRHNEGHLNLCKLMQKRFKSGRDAARYVAKRPKAGFKSFFPIRGAYLRNWRKFLSRPLDTLFFLIMRIVEYLSGTVGFLYSLINNI